MAESISCWLATSQASSTQAFMMENDDRERTVNERE